MSDAPERLRAALRASGGPLTALLERPAPAGGAAAPASAPAPAPARADRAAHGGGDDPIALAARGPRVEDRRDAVELAVAAVLEGCLLHYGRPRALSVEDPDLALLAGDRLYALGLAELASAGDMTAIAELADVIALSAQAHAAGDEPLALAAWEAGAAAIGWGPSPALAAAKERARRGEPDAAAALRAAAAAARTG